MHSQRGFSLIEAMVALVILAGASLALFGWLNTSLNQLNRAALYTEASPALKSIINYLTFQNLNQKATGAFTFGDVSINWQATPIEEGQTHSVEQEEGNFELALYEVSLFPKVRQQTLPVLVTRVVTYQLKPNVGQNPFE